MLWLLAGCGPLLDDADWEAIARMGPLPPLPADPTNAVADDDGAAALGRALFFDARLSADGTVACATCHDAAQAFTDGLAVAEGLGTTTKNAPTVLDSARNRWFFWNGRADTAWTQALGPLENPVEHGTSRLAVAHLVHDDPELRAGYEAVFGALPPLDDGARFPPDGRPVPDDVTDPAHQAWTGMDEADRDAVDAVFADVGKALAAYQRRLATGESALDRFVSGDEGALGEAEQRGLDIFVGRGGCVLCHSGPELSDREFHNLALPADGEPDPGRYAGITTLLADPFNGAGLHSDDPEAGLARIGSLVQGDEQVGQFKTPSLRNVALTAPYMHAGQFATLEEVVGFYSTLDVSGGAGHREEIVVPLELDDGEVADLVAFLESLTGAPPDPAWSEPP